MAIRIYQLTDLPIGYTTLPALGAADHVDTVTASSDVIASPFREDTRFVAIDADEDCHVVFGDNPTATTSGIKVRAASCPVVFRIPVSDYKVAWIAA